MSDRAPDDLLVDKQIEKEYPGAPRPKTLQNWRHARKGPPYIKIGGLVRYRRKDFEAFLTARCVLTG